MNRMIWFFCFLFSLSNLQLAQANFFDRYEKLTPQDVSELSFTDTQGYPVTLAAFKGRLVVLNIWSITCGPCVAEMPSLDQLAGSFKEDELAIIPLNVDPIKKIGLDRFYEKNQYRYLGIFQDPLRQSQKIFQWNALPTTLIINKDGQLIGRKIGAMKWDDPQVVKILQQLVDGKEIEEPQQSVLDKIKHFFGLKS